MASLYLTDKCFIGRRHPTTRILMLLTAFAPPMITHKLEVMAAVLTLYVIASFVSGAWRNLWRARWFIFLFLTITISLWSVFHKAGDAPYFQWGPISPSPGSVFYGLAMALRLICFLVAALIFLSATKVEDINYGLIKLGAPYRGAFALSLAFRLTPLFTESANQISTAQRMRGLDTSAGNIIQKTRRYIAILAPVLIAALRRANGLAVALEAKGFGMKQKRTSLMRYPLSAMDFLWPALMGGLIALTVLYVHFHDYFEGIAYRGF